MNTSAQALIDEVRANRLLRSRSRAARQAAGVTQGRMALTLGVDRTTLVRWESGAMTPRPAQRQRWQDLVGQLEEASAA